jgi:hypothetical protein
VIQLSDAAWTAAATVLVAIITPVAAVVMKRSDKAVKTSDQANKTSESTATATHDLDAKVSAMADALADVSNRLKQQEKKLTLFSVWAQQITQWADAAYRRLRQDEPDWPKPPKLPARLSTCETMPLRESVPPSMTSTRTP